MLRLSRNSNLAVTGFFANQLPASAIIEELMGTNAAKALVLAAESPAIMFQRVRTKSSSGDAMFVSPLEFAVLTGHEGVLLVLKGIAKKAGLIDSYNFQQANMAQKIAQVEQLRQAKAN